MSIIQWFRDRIIAIGAVLLAILTVLGAVYGKGRRDEEVKTEKKSQELSEKAHDAASTVEEHVSKLPPPPAAPGVKATVGNEPATRVSDAPANTAAGELRDDWTRD